MIVDCLQTPAAEFQTAGPLIIGSGPVGIVLALFLARRRQPVLLIEGGDWFPNAERAADLQAETIAGDLPGVLAGRTRQIGGGLNLWGGQLASFHAQEFAANGSGEPGWPIPLAEITARFANVADLLGQPSAHLPPRAPKLGIDQSALQMAGLQLVATAWLKQPKLSKQIWQDIKQSPYITLVHGAHAHQLVTDGNGAVTGVNAVRADGSTVRFTGRAVVLACGTIEAVRLLLQPSPVLEAQPWHALHWLGRGFNEHLDATTARVRPLDARQLRDLFDPLVVDGTKYTYKLFSEYRAPEASPVSAVAILTMPGNIRNSLSELRMLLRGLSPKQARARSGQIFAAALASAREVGPLAWRYMRHKRIGTVLRGEALLRVSIEQRARADNRITLSPTRRDSRGVPAAQIHWTRGEEEGRAFLDMTRKVAAWAERNSIARVEMEPLLAENPAAFALAADDGLHHSGGARMALRATDGVVDAGLKVFGTRNLYCCGASVFPRSGFANPTFTALALAVRLGERLLEARQP